MTDSRTTTRHALPVFNGVFAVLLVFYWMVQFVRGDNVSALPNEIAYYFNIIPAVLFVAGGLGYIFVNNLSYDKIITPLLIYAVVTIGIAVSRGDFPSAASSGLMVCTLIIFFTTKPNVSASLINTLFLISIAITTIFYFFDFSIYTAFPGLNTHPEIWWRASPLPTSSNGGFFAMFVLLMNLVHRHIPGRVFFILLALFFVVVSGNRTAFAAIVISSIYYVGVRQGILASDAAKAAFATIAALGFMASIYSSQLFLSLSILDNDFLRVLFFREERITFDAEGNVTSAGIRTWIINQNLSLFWENPFTGIGSFDLRALQSGYGAMDDLTTGSEAYLSYLLARYGVAALLLIYVLIMAKRPLTGDAAILSSVTRLALLIALFTYGSFANPYDFIFLMMLMGITGGIAAPPAPRAVPLRAANPRPQDLRTT